MEPLTAEQATQALATARWTWAKTYSKTAPHYYTLRKHWQDADFERVVAAIYQYGQVRYWRGRPFRYFIPGDGNRYWTMGEPVKQTGGINRCPEDQAY